MKNPPDSPRWCSASHIDFLSNLFTKTVALLRAQNEIHGSPNEIHGKILVPEPVISCDQCV